MEKNKIEIIRSFAQKLNTGNYTTADFYCSAKVEIDEKDLSKRSEELFEICYLEVMSSIMNYQDKISQKVNKDWDEKKQKLYNEGTKQDDLRVEELRTKEN